MQTEETKKNDRLKRNFWIVLVLVNIIIVEILIWGMVLYHKS